MTEIHNASLAAGASSAELTVNALEPHGLNPEVDCQAFSKNVTTGRLFELALLRAGEPRVIFPTTATMVVRNVGAAAGVIQVTAK